MSSTCLVTVLRNCYSVPCELAGDRVKALVLETGAVNAEHVLNVIGRLTASAPPDQVATALSLNAAPRADTGRHARLRAKVAGQEVGHA